MKAQFPAIIRFPVRSKEHSPRQKCDRSPSARGGLPPFAVRSFLSRAPLGGAKPGETWKSLIPLLFGFGDSPFARATKESIRMIASSGESRLIPQAARIEFRRIPISSILTPSVVSTRLSLFPRVFRRKIRGGNPEVFPRPFCLKTCFLARAMRWRSEGSIKFGKDSKLFPSRFRVKKIFSEDAGCVKLIKDYGEIINAGIFAKFPVWENTWSLSGAAMLILRRFCA